MYDLIEFLPEEDRKEIKTVYSYIYDIYGNIESEKNMIAKKEKELLKNNEIFNQISDQEKKLFEVFKKYADLYSSNDQEYEHIQDLSVNSSTKRQQLIEYIEELYKLKWTNLKF